MSEAIYGILGLVVGVLAGAMITLYIADDLRPINQLAGGDQCACLPVVRVKPKK